MRSRARAVGAVVLLLLLAGCTAAPGPAATRTVTVTATPPAPALGPAEAAPWDLHAVCAAESAISTLATWRDDQTAAGRLSPAQAEAVLQGVAVQYQTMDQFGVPAEVRQEVGALASAAGTLARPRIDLGSTAVRTARTGLRRTCQRAGLTVAVFAQGG